MKSFFYISFMLVLLAIMGLFFIKKPEGDPWLSMTQVKHMSLKSIATLQSYVSNSPPELVIRDKEQAKIKVYKWQDKTGVWHYADSPSKDNQSEKIIIEASNILPSSYFISEQGAQDTSTKNASAIKTDLSFSPDNVVDNAKGIQQLVDERQKKLDNVTK